MPVSKPPILLSGYFGFGNLGDEAILEGAVAEIRRREPGAAIAAISGNPAETARRLAIEAVDFHDLDSIDRAVAGSRRVLFGMGGVFQDYWGALSASLFREKTVGVEAYARPALLAGLHGVPAALFAAGVGPLETEAGRRLFAMACRDADALVVRDEASAQHARSSGVLTPVSIGADAAFLLDPEPGEAPRRLASIGLADAPFVAFALRDWTFGSNEEQIVAQAVRAVSSLPSGWKAVFIPFHRGGGTDDASIAARAASACGARGVVVEADTAGEASALLERARAVVAMRLHAVVLASLSGTPAVSLAYDTKVASAAARLGLEQWTLTLGEADRLPEALREAVAAEEALRGRLAASARASRREAAAAFELIEPSPEETAPRAPVPADDLPKTLGRLAETAATLHQQSAAHHRRLRLLAQQDAAREILAIESEFPVREERAQAELAHELEEAAARSRSERERWLAELMRVRAASWDAKMQADRYAVEAQAREREAREAAHDAAASSDALLAEQKALARHQRNLLERQVVEARQEVTRFQSSRLWRAASVFWAARRKLSRGRAALSRRSGGRRADTSDSEEAPSESPPAALPTTLPAENRHDILCLPIIDWDFRFQRPQQLMKQFAQAGHRVFYIAQSFRPDGPAYSVSEKIPNLFEVSLRGPVRNVYKDVLEPEAAAALLEGLESMRKDLDLGGTAQVVQLPFWRPVAKALRERHAWPVVYDLMDHHAGFTSNTQAMLREERELLETADLVLASSAFLEAEAQRHSPRVLPLKNACDYAHFTRAERTGPPAERPVVGYYGAISDWFDTALVEDLARRRPDWDFVLVGSTWGADVSRLQSLPNVRLPGEKPYAQIPSELASFDVVFIPFRRIPLTEATNPVKAYEILAGGKPLVAVPLPELLPMAPLVRFAETAEDFEREIAAALAERGDAARADARRTYAREHTWDTRFAALAPAVAQAFPKASVVIVTFHNRDLNRLCLESVYARTEWPNFEVIVVDNGSTDGTPEMLREAQDRFPRLTVLANAENRGFAAANNQGIAHSGGDTLVLLNNDTVVSRGWLSRLIGHLAADPRLGLVGPTTNAISNEQKVAAGYASIAEMPAWAAQRARRHDGELTDLPMIAMFCVAMRRSVFQEVGPLDERFAVGMFEDDDYCRRVRQKGYRIRVAQDVYLHHWQRASFKLLGEAEYQRVFEENRRRYEEKWGAWVRPSGSAPPPEGRLKRQLEEVAARAASKRGTVIFLPSIGWDIPLFQRPHHLARAFARRGWVAVFDCSNARDNVDGFKEIEPDLFLYRGPEGVLPRLAGAVLWSFPYNFELVDAYPAGARTIYDWIDDLDVFPQERSLLERNHARGLADATVVASVARRLHEQALAARPDAIYLPNGVEFERFAADTAAPQDPALAGLLARRAPIAGYYGALARWFDYDLLDAVAARKPDWSFLLIGPNHDGSAKGQRLFRRGNVDWIGPRDYAALPGYLGLFEVATIPFAINPITTATSPLKLFEYFAGGKPVVTTPMPECAAFPEVGIGQNPEAFAAALDVARQRGQDPAFRERLRALGRESSWEARVETAVAALSSAPAAADRPSPAVTIADAKRTRTGPRPPEPPIAIAPLDSDEDEVAEAETPIAVAPRSSNGSVGPPRPLDLPGPFGQHALGGHCLVCGRDTDFLYDSPEAYREELACVLCRATSRYRSIARGLLEAIRSLAGVEADSLASLPREKAGARLSVYDTQTPFAYMTSAYAIPELLARCAWIDLSLSTWNPRRVPGRRLGPHTTNQNLERLTFPDAAFDVVVTSDVLAHVRLEERAHREIRRVLKPGGLYIFTLPCLRDREGFSRVHVVDPDDPSKDDWLAPPYHGDAGAVGARALIYRDFGLELDARLEGLGFEVAYTRERFERLGILETELFVCRRQ